MKEILFELMYHNTKGVDTYYNNGSMWLIFTDEEKWVLELTKDGTLWYNFYFFQGCFKYLSLDVVENQHYITEWVEDTIQNGVKHTEYGDWLDGDERLHEIIQNGIKETRLEQNITKGEIDDIIQNGIKKTHVRRVDNHPSFMDRII